MATIDLDKFLQPLAEDSPCGENLEYDPEFGELERAAQGTPEHVMGDEVIEAEEPRWDEVFEKAEALLDRTRDLRVAIYLARAGLNLDGFTTFADGMRLVAGFVQTFWDGVHPELDAEDNNDPTLRINSLLELNSRGGLLRDLGRAPLVDSRGVGRFGLRDIQVAAGEIAPADGEDAPESGLVDAAFMDVDVEQLNATAQAVAQASAAIQEMQNFIVDQVGTQFAPDLGPLSGEIAKIRKILAEKLALRGVAEPGAEEEGTDEAAAGAGPAAAMSMAGEIRSREDAIRLIDKLSEYFRRYEPSSPVPLLLERAKRLISKDFLEILRDLAPEGLSSAQHISGVSGEGE